MNAPFLKYTCSSCGKQHEEWPALAFEAPHSYHSLSEEDRENIAEIGSDFCVISHPGQTDRFIRGTLVQSIADHCETLHYGLWVSLSEKSFEDYKSNYHSENHETSYFGWLSNDIPEYDFSKGFIPATVFTRPGNSRPEIVPHQDFDHPFVHDYYNGISKQEAEKRIHAMLNQLAEKTQKKPWWKIW